MSDRMLRAAVRALEQGRAWAGLTGDALAWVLARLGSDTSAPPWLVVVDEPDAAERLARGLAFFTEGRGDVEVFPADDVRPYDGFSPSPDVPAQRHRVLHRLRHQPPRIVIAPARALMQRVPTAEVRATGTLVLRPGDRLDRDVLVERLTAAGYLATQHVDAPGRFAVRGDVVDVWSAGGRVARRVDFFDDEIESVRKLDPSTRRAGRPVEQVVLLPAREERVDADALQRLTRVTAEQVREQGRGQRLRRRLIEEVRAGIRLSAIEDYLPALVETVDPLEALAACRPLVVHPGSVAASLREGWATASRRWSELDEEERPLVTPSMRWVDPEAVLEGLRGAHRVLELAHDGAVDLGGRSVEGLAVRGADLGPVVGKLRKWIDDDVAVGLVARDSRRLDALETLLADHGLPLRTAASPEDLKSGRVAMLVGDLPRGFLAPEAGVAWIPGRALFGGPTREAHHRAHALFDVAVKHVAELKESDLVVHKLHGIGRYLGLQRLEMHGGHQDFVHLEYRGGDKLYLPVTDLGKLSKYTPSQVGVETKLDRLGGATWAARKGKVRDALLSKAQELLDLHARRELASREPHAPPGELYRRFEAGFPYVETPDQAAAIVDVQEDLTGDAPMDRLVCGDVGFGKTEVAMRAAMRVVEGGAQVAVLCPTTVLAFQHHLSFSERFEGLPVTVAMLSRFQSPAEQKDVLDGLREGRIDVVVGTHALLGRRVRYRKLGMVVVDEEHRFGVRQKNRLKQMRAEVDLLSMSATPIPRTLQMALSGLQEMSLITTPPEDRLPVQTMIARFTKTRVADALRMELERGGQAYVLHNRVESIDAFADRLAGWVPEARFRVAHGQMKTEALEQVLIAFMKREFDVLVCTAIVESGVDLPNVNTMLIDRADRFGLSQLYQLRGRVGRSDVRGRCLLLTPETLTRDARRRLQVLVDNTRLGSGFAVAAADLEIRGGGNLLGESQSGHIDAVGYDTWVELLEEAVAHARGRAEHLQLDPEVEVPVEAFLPEQLVPDVTERLSWYRRIAGVTKPDQTEHVLDDLERERGSLPEEVHNLAGLVETKLLCRELGLVRCHWLRIRTLFELHPSSPLTTEHLDALVAEHPKRFAWAGGQKGQPVTFTARFTPKEGAKPFRYLRWVLAQLQRRLD